MEVVSVGGGESCSGDNMDIGASICVEDGETSRLCTYGGRRRLSMRAEAVANRELLARGRRKLKADILSKIIFCIGNGKKVNDEGNGDDSAASCRQREIVESFCLTSSVTEIEDSPSENNCDDGILESTHHSEGRRRRHDDVTGDESYISAAVAMSSGDILEITSEAENNREWISRALLWTRIWQMGDSELYFTSSQVRATLTSMKEKLISPTAEPEEREGGRSGSLSRRWWSTWQWRSLMPPNAALERLALLEIIEQLSCVLSDLLSDVNDDEDRNCLRSFVERRLSATRAVLGECIEEWDAEVRRQRAAETDRWRREEESDADVRAVEMRGETRLVATNEIINAENENFAVGGITLKNDGDDENVTGCTDKDGRTDVPVLVEETRKSRELAELWGVWWHPHLAVGDCTARDGTGRGVVATGEIKEGESVVEIEESFLVNVYFALRDPGFRDIALWLLATMPKYFEEKGNDNGENGDDGAENDGSRGSFDLSAARRVLSDPCVVVLLVYLMHERYRGQSSPMYTYFRTLPVVEEWERQRTDSPQVAVSSTCGSPSASSAPSSVSPSGGGWWPNECPNFYSAPADLLRELRHQASEALCEMNQRAAIDMFQWLEPRIKETETFVDCPAAPARRPSVGCWFTWTAFCHAKWIVDSRSFALLLPPPPNVDYNNSVLHNDDMNNFHHGSKGAENLSSGLNEFPHPEERFWQLPYDQRTIFTAHDDEQSEEPTPNDKNDDGEGESLAFLPCIREVARAERKTHVTVRVPHPRTCTPSSSTPQMTMDSSPSPPLSSSSSNRGIQFTVRPRVVSVLVVTDLFNHSTTAQLAVSSKGGVDRRLLNSSNGKRRVVRFVAEAAIRRPMAQVYISYGPMPSWEVASQYGFVPLEASLTEEIHLKLGPDDECSPADAGGSGGEEFENGEDVVKALLLKCTRTPTEHIIRAARGSFSGMAVPELMKCLTLCLATGDYGEVLNGNFASQPELVQKCISTMTSILHGIAFNHREALASLAAHRKQLGAQPYWYPRWGATLRRFHEIQIEVAESSLLTFAQVVFDEQ